MLRSDEGLTQSLSDCDDIVGVEDNSGRRQRRQRHRALIAGRAIRNDGIGRFRLERIERCRRPLNRVDREVVIF
jgi:hypothetical protein